jgi:chitin disaccharide deacetylase
MKKIIINADDFGLNTSVNKAIVESFNNSFINSTTLMANMPGFEEAVDLAHCNYFMDKIGIHLNLDAGHLLTSDLLNTNLFDKENHIHFRNNKRMNLFFISKVEKNLIYKEFSAQIGRVKKSGIKITHIDTHHHIHEIWPITRIVLTLLAEHNISSMRILNNLNFTNRFYKFGYRKLVNRYIIKNKANFSDFLGNQLDAIFFIREDRSFFEDKKLEIMVHPDFNNEGVIIDRLQNREVPFNYPDEIKIVNRPE